LISSPSGDLELVHQSADRVRLSGPVAPQPLVQAFHDLVVTAPGRQRRIQVPHVDIEPQYQGLRPRGTDRPATARQQRSRGKTTTGRRGRREETARADRYAVAYQEHLPDWAGATAVACDRRGQPMAYLNVTVPTYYYSESELRALVGPLRQAATDLEHRLLPGTPLENTR
jgi:hypothetical protein